MLNDITNSTWRDDTVKMDKAVSGSKRLFKENRPYIEEETLIGTNYIFGTGFTAVLVKLVLFDESGVTGLSEKAMTNGCMSEMNAAEKEVFINWVEYMNTVVIVEGDQEQTDAQTLAERETLVHYNVSKALDEWFVRAVLCQEQPSINACWDAESNLASCEGE